MLKSWKSFLLLAILLFPFVSAVDVAYILEDSSQVSSPIIFALNSKGLTYNIVKDSQIPTTDFSQYSLLLITEDVDKVSNLPLNQKNAIFFDRKTADEVWTIGSSGQTTYKKIEAEDESSFAFNQITIPSNDEIEIYTTPSALHYLSPPIRNIHVAAIKVGYFRPIVAYSESNEIKNFFFGAPVFNNWNSNGKKIFENALTWVIGNSPPTIQNIQDITVFETDLVTITVQAVDS